MSRRSKECEMLIRTPTPKPISCYGSEHSSSDSKCQSCPHQPGCIVAMGTRLGKVTLDKAAFNFMSRIIDIDESTPDNDVNAVYDICHESVYGTSPNTRIPRGGSEKIMHAAEESNCDVRLYIMANMMAQKKKDSSGPFYANMLFGPTAIRRVTLWRKLCSQTYGHFDIHTIGLALDCGETNDIAVRMANSEIIFGQTIVGLKLGSGSKPYDTVFKLKELAFDPSWLSIEDTYGPTLIDSIKSSGIVTSPIQRVRFNVSQYRKRLKKESHRLSSLIKIRESVMPKAIMTVLGYHHLRPVDFEIKNEPVTSPSAFWSVLGTAISQYYCWRAVNGDKYALNQISRC